MGNVNRKATSREIEHLRAVVLEAFPDCEVVIGGHGDYGGHRAPRDHTLSFRLRGRDGRFCSNVVWVQPEHLLAYTPELVRARVRWENGQRPPRR